MRAGAHLEFIPSQHIYCTFNVMQPGADCLRALRVAPVGLRFRKAAVVVVVVVKALVLL